MRYVFVIAAMFAAVATPAAAQETETPSVLRDVYGCADIADDAQRLACYDGAVGRLRQAETQGQVVAVDRQQAAEIRREAFGFSLPNLGRLLPQLGDDEEAASAMEMVVERMTQNSTGRTRFVMANGQVWSQVEPTSVRNVRPGDAVTVRRASLGSYMLSSSRGGPAHRVRREE